MERRDFLKRSIGAGILTGVGLSLGNIPGALGMNPAENPLAYDLVAIKGGEPEVMFDKAIAQLGGIKSFVKKGQKVLVKPNIGWDVSPERGGNTNPKLVARIVKHCLEAGAKEVYVFDNTCDKWNNCYKNSGIEKAVKDAGGKIVPGNTESYYQTISIGKGKKLKSAKVHELVLDTDVFINVPVLKHHSSSNVTISMKNLMGIVWDRSYWHRTDLHQCIADCASLHKPTLNVVDAYRVMLKNGPRGVSEKDIVTMKQMIISPDIVAADAAAAKIFGLDPDEVPYIRIANAMKIGQGNLKALNIKKIIL